MAVDLSTLTDEELLALEKEQLSSGAGAPGPYAHLSDDDLKAVGSQYEYAPAEREPEEEATLEDLIRGNTGARFLQGIADLPQGAVQLALNAGEAIYGGGRDPDAPSFTKSYNKILREQEESRERGQRALTDAGETEFDIAGLAGEMVAAGPLVKAVGTGIKGAVAAGGLIGGSTPTTDEDFWETKAIQTGGGAGFGGGLVGTGKLIQATGAPAFIASKVGPLFTEAKELAGKAIRDVIGEDKIDDVIAALYADINPLTKGSAAEVAQKAGSTKFSALQKAVDELLPDEAYAREQAQTAQRLGVVEDLAAGGDEAIALREQVTKPMREQALESANVNTQTAMRLEEELGRKGISSYPPGEKTTQVQARVRDVYQSEAEKQATLARMRSDVQVPGQPRVPPRYSRQQELLENAEEFGADAKTLEQLAKARQQMLEYQQRSMAEHGIEAATPNTIVTGIDSALRSPKVVGNPTLRSVMQKVRSELEEMVEPDGTISPEALYEYRKQGLNHTIEQYLSNSDPALRQSITSSLSNLKPLVDDVIEKAAGGGWKRYLKEYERLSEPVNQAEIGKVLKKAFANSLSEGRVRPQVLTNALDDAKGLMRKSGVRKGLDVLNPEQKAQVSALQGDLARADNVAQMAKAGRVVGPAALTKDYTAQLANPLMREIMVTNAILRSVGKGKRRQVEKEIGQMFQRDPDGTFNALAKAIEQADPKDKKFLVQLAQQFSATMARATPGVTAGQMEGVQ